ncbi:MAG TPA: type II secretion system F family protein [Anaerolineales bacterium]|nr:type II secretion system F family protein [Anaerolineales bacterium]
MTPFLLVLLVGGVLALLLLIVGVVTTVTSEQSFVEQRLGRYLEDDTSKKAKKKDKESPVGDWINVRLERSSWGDRIARELARADLKLRVGEYVALIVIAGFGLGFLSWYFGGRSILFALLGALFGTFLPRIYVGRQKSLRLVRFNDQLADMLNLMVNGLRAGYSTMQAMEAVSKELPPPISDEFHRVVQELQLGISNQDALDNLLRRIPSDDLDLVVAAMNVQREVGGNLAEILDVISHTIRERVRVKGEIRVLTSQVIYSGRFLSAMPAIISLTLWLVNRPYMMEFFNPETRVVGIIMLTIGVMMVASGYYAMTRLARIDV